MKNIIVTLMLLIAGQYASAQNPKIMDLCRYADSTKLGSCRAFYTAGDGEPTRFVVNISLYDVHGDNTVLVDRQGRVVDNWDSSKEKSELSKRVAQVCEELSKDAVDACRVEWHRKLQDVYKRMNGKALDSCEANPIVDDVEYAIVMDRDDDWKDSGEVTPSSVRKNVKESIRFQHSAKWSVCDMDLNYGQPMPLYTDSLGYYCAVDSVVAERKYIDAKDYMDYVAPILKGIKHRNVSYYCDSILTPEVEKEMLSPIRYPDHRAPYTSSTEGVIYEFDSKEQYEETHKRMLNATLAYVKLHPDVGYDHIYLVNGSANLIDGASRDVIRTFNDEMKDGKAPKNFCVAFRSVRTFEPSNFKASNDGGICCVDKGIKYYLYIMDTTGDLRLPRQWDKASRCVNGKYTYLKGMGK